MFDDSKRLDALEKQMAEIFKAHNDGVEARKEWYKKFSEFDTAITKRLDEAIKAINDHIALFQKHDKAQEAAQSKMEGAIAKLQQRCANLEAAVKKLQK